VWPDPRRIQARIGVQLQSTSLFDMLTARELLELFARFYLRPDVAERARISLALVGLETKADDYAKRLSGGQQQRLAIALALVHDPEIVFLDEPTTGLDPQARHNLWDVIRSINGEQGKTVVLTTHYLEEAEQLCDRVAIMDEARIVALDTPAGLVAALNADARVSYTDASGDHTVYVKDAQATVLEVLERARAEGQAVQNLSVKGADLEDVFMQLTGREYRE
jgi:ABC-2 type transport system ATP-binding protein